MRNSSSIKLMKPIWMTLRALGALPLDEKFQSPRRLILWSAAVNICLILSNVYQMNISTIQKLTTTFLFHNIRMVILSSVICINLYRYYTKNQLLHECLQDIWKTETMLSTREVCVSYNRSSFYKTWVFFVAFLTSKILVYCVFMQLYENHVLYKYLLMFVSIFLCLLIEFHFLMLVSIVGALLEAVVTSINTNISKKQLEALIQVLCTICDLADNINSFFSLQNLLIITYFYISFIDFSGDLIATYEKGIENTEYSIEKHIVKYTGLVFAILFSFSNLYMIAEYCANTKNKVHKVNRSLFKVILENGIKKNNLFSEKMRLHFEVNRQINFTAFSIFSIDFSMVHSVLFSCSVILTIIFQKN
ncbi:Gustatory receptor 164 [Halyomorpha halys]|nr:Gustatory receptor 164 [Halyomorpha halys]